MENEIIKQVVNSIKSEILSNKEFMKEIIGAYQLEEKNIPASLIIKLMGEANKSQQPNQPKSNAPKDRIAGIAKPVDVIADSIAAKVVSDLLEGNNVYLLGKAGTGKTYLAKALGETVLGQPVFTINCSQWTSPIEIRGGQTIKGYQEGELMKAWASGGLLILDELPKLDPNTAGLLNDGLAEAASQPKYNEDGTVKEDTIPYITNGRGEKIYKGELVTEENLKKQYNNLRAKEKSRITEEEYVKQGLNLRFRFCVIATGNTDMMNVGNKYGGNQRQDYSLVDRFAGSYYELGIDYMKEQALTYSYVWGICNAMRNFLIKFDAPQSISLRTMLNFNRTYEQEMLYKFKGSPFADKIYSNSGAVVAPKSISDSIASFKRLLEPTLVVKLEADPSFKGAVESVSNNDKVFKAEFVAKYHLNPATGAEETPAK